MRPWIVATLLWGALCAPAAAAEVVDIPMADGVRLHATIFRPSGSARVPVVVVAGPYGTGETTTEDLVTGAPPGLVEKGFAVVDVSLRGTGCSDGSWDPFAPQEARDVAAVVEWAAAQPWSSGHVGMAGVSYLGTVQLLAAALHPKGLDAIAPIVPVGDVYRDLTRPGGVLDLEVPAAFAAVPAASYDGACSPNQQAATGWMTTTPIAQQLDSADYRARSTVNVAGQITTPTLITSALQDDVVRQGGVEVYRRLAGPARLILTAGLHDTPEHLPLVQSRVTSWLSYWLRDRYAASGSTTTGMHRRSATVRDGRRRSRARRRATPLDSTDPVTVLYDLASKDLTPGLTSTFSDWPPKGTRKVIALGSSGYDQLDTLGATSSRQGSPTQPPFAVTWTTAAFGDATVLTGDASLHLEFTSTAADADLYAVLSEVRTDGNVTPFARVPLHLAVRAVDASRSRPGAPFHPFDTYAQMPTGTRVSADLGFGPIAHLLRAGSKLQIRLTAPPGGDPVNGASYAPSTTDAGVLTIDRAASHVDLPLVTAPAKLPPQPACGTTVGEVCGANG